MEVTKFENLQINKDQEAVIELISLLESIDPNAPESPENEMTISDNNGGRIYL